MDVQQLRQVIEEQLQLSRRQQARIRELETAARPPLAVVGMGLRLPGDLRTPERYWTFLREGGRALSPIPQDRPGLRDVHRPGPVTPGHSYVDHAAFLNGIADFDADFFGISQREAELLDPQQRMLLETAWEALERAGIAVRRSDRLDVGVYLGMMASEYGERLAVRTDKTPLDPYYATGGGLCFGAGRISYVMGFSGPVVSVDTACSSSLVAFHLAVRALRAGDCRYALVCGSNLLLSANLMVSLCQSRALAPDGRSKSFLATADGYGRGEGVGVLVLMRLDQAEREGRPIHAVVRGSAVNHDGAASGLTVPNGPAQEEVVRAALADAGVSAADLGWVEAHGTGTLLGDPIEIGALDAALGAAVRERGIPLAVGSVKSRIGHLEAASGIASLMKTVLMLEHGEIPAATGDEELNTHIPWDRISFTVPRANQPWPVGLSRRVAGVNSFGMSGTNAHVVLEAYAAEPQPPVPIGPELLTLSARDPEALRTLATTVAARLLRGGPERFASICHTLRTGRAPFAYRLAVTGDDPAELAEHLLAAEGAANAVVRRVTLFTGPDDAAALAALAQIWPVPAAGGFAAVLERFGVAVRAGGYAPAARLEWGDGRRAFPLTGAEPAGLLLTALAALFTDGADLRLEALRRPGVTVASDLPTYPFRRRRFWVDEPKSAGSSTPTGRPAIARPTDRDGIEDYLMAELREVLHATEDLDPNRSFLETGGDSFVSTLYMSRIEEQFDVGLAPEDLPIDRPLSDLLTTLADHITDRLVVAADGESL
ncbi:beta-ketoacyl synthase N-terminal-like domain-containing protein [Micromonospora sp. CA-259024]|uniref:beta-ketoacyl synthase N-terminal-like domain-containing protein n=1 Tax=Micromonospora sp. CA-259024 TaxID=3239965 RepID=UPI003D8D8713